MPHTITMTPIGILEGDFPEKFGLPRQSGLAPAAQATLSLARAYAHGTRGLEGFSHVWLLYHAHATRGWKPTVRPPRLGGNVSMGVFATRSPFRPNPIGLSVVRLISVKDGVAGAVVLTLGGVDLMSGTPILDVKPYLPYADRIDDAVGGFAAEAPSRWSVEWSSQALSDLEGLASERPRLRALIEQTLAFDPRPAYRPDVDRRRYTMSVLDVEVCWTWTGAGSRVLTLIRAG